MTRLVAFFHSVERRCTLFTTGSLSLCILLLPLQAQTAYGQVAKAARPAQLLRTEALKPTTTLAKLASTSPQLRKMDAVLRSRGMTPMVGPQDIALKQIIFRDKTGRMQTGRLYLQTYHDKNSVHPVALVRFVTKTGRGYKGSTAALRITTSAGKTRFTVMEVQKDGVLSGSGVDPCTAGNGFDQETCEGGVGPDGNELPGDPTGQPLDWECTAIEWGTCFVSTGFTAVSAIGCFVVAILSCN